MSEEPAVSWLSEFRDGKRLFNGIRLLTHPLSSLRGRLTVSRYENPQPVPNALPFQALDKTANRSSAGRPSAQAYHTRPRRANQLEACETVHERDCLLPAFAM